MKVFFLMVWLFSWGLLVQTGQAQTMGLQTHATGAEDGYFMINRNGAAYLLDKAGRTVHAWQHGINGSHPGYLMDNGDWFMVRRGVKRYDWDGNLLWEYNNTRAHHDVAVLPSGNVLLLVYGEKSAAEAVAAGRDPNQLDAGLDPMVIFEVNPQGDVVWEWHVWDHLIQDHDPNQNNYGVVSDHPERVDINHMRSTDADWIHGNAIDYNPDLDQIMVSSRHFNEFWIIDHSTTTAEAAGHAGGQGGKGGDLLYRWGNPAAYQAPGFQMYFGGHNAQWIQPGLPGEGNILFFNNGGLDYGREGDFSTVESIVPPLNGHNYDLLVHGAFGPLDVSWSYQASEPESFYSSYISGVQRLPGGNTFIDEGDDGLLFEVTPSGERVWQYQSPLTIGGNLYQGEDIPFGRANSLFRATHYPKDHPAFQGKELSPGGTLELYDQIYNLDVSSDVPELLVYPALGSQNVGQGQLMPLLVDDSSQFLFSHWSVTFGAPTLGDVNSVHTTVQLQGAAAIHAHFVTNPDYIFADGFEQL